MPRGRRRKIEVPTDTHTQFELGDTAEDIERRKRKREERERIEQEERDRERMKRDTKAKYIPGWVNETVIAAKETKRLFERIWRRNKPTFNRSQYMQKVHQYNKICMQAKSEFLKAKIRDSQHNPQKLWRVLADVLHRLPAKILPSINTPQLSADRFVGFFTEKICSTFSTSLNLQYITPDSPPPMFASFSTVTEDQVTKIIKDSPSKSCSLGPLFLFLSIWIFSSPPSLQ